MGGGEFTLTLDLCLLEQGIKIVENAGGVPKPSRAKTKEDQTTPNSNATSEQQEGSAQKKRTTRGGNHSLRKHNL